ncbi:MULTISPECIES: ABC-2 family transporter protein [unclassified Actinotalea]|uniref:ABC transporter permease n=1 Tax=unclassified Actinotalea TaxID=2638618 RepID=UPI001C712FC9|nr:MULTISPECIES: ABC-2 family transporter protein [unclassified Actinotalea]
MSAAAADVVAPGRAPDGARVPLGAYRALAGTAFKSLLAYRLQFFLGLLGNLFLLLSLFYLWRTILREGQQPLGFTWPDMKAYLLIGFVSGTVVSTYTDWRMAQRIQDGSVAVDLTKPVDYQRARLAEALGFAAFELVACALVAVGALAVFGGVAVPPPGTLALFVVSILAVVPLKFTIVYMSGLLCFWTQSYMGVSWARLALQQLFSGAMVPLAFFPDWLRVIAEVLPFQAMAYTPAMLYLGRLEGAELWWRLGGQLGWTLLLWWAARAAWRAASRRLTVHGG